MKHFSLIVFFVFLLGGTWSPAGAYDYTFRDPYVATVIGTPSEFQAKLPEKIDYKMLSFKVFPERVVPDVFWYQQEFRYSLTYQKGEAPLIFVIAGTGSSFYSSNMIFFQRIFSQAGFHVICLPSPTSMNFITTASVTSLPGNIIADAVDLYRVMTMAWEQVKGRITMNTTVGLGGVIDVATHEGVRRENEDFGQTLGFYGLGHGPYLVLPIFGPSGLRDTTGLAVDKVVYILMMNQLVDELTDLDGTDADILKYSLTGLSAIDLRHNESFRYFMTGSPFEYELIRKLYQVQREFLIEN